MPDAEAHRVPADLAGQRADRIVAALLEVSRSAARAIVDRGDATIDGAPVAPSARLDHDVVVTIIPPEPEGPLEPATIEFDVVLDDADVLVVDKPAGLVVHPGAGHRNDTLANGLIERFPELGEMGEAHRWGLVHRLDRDTTGLLLVARNPEAHRFLQNELKERRIGRVYWSMALGEFENTTGTIEAPIGRDPAAPTRMRVISDGRHAVTHYRRLASWPGVTLLEVHLETGRTHQIRVHLAAIGHPVSGDRAYGRVGPEAADPGRVWLHARQLTFPHPAGSGDVTAIAPLPSDLASTFDHLGAPDRGAVPDY